MARKTKPSTKRPAKRMPKRGRRARGPQTQWATATQTMDLADCQTRSVYSFSQIKLSSFDRLAAIAANYAEYRITKVELSFKPYYDTFIAASGSIQTVPYLYYYVNKAQNNMLASFNALQDAGAKPIRFDERTIKVAFKPAVLQYLRDVNTAPAIIPNWGKYITSPWLATSQAAGDIPSISTFVPSNVEHGSILWGVNTTVGLPATNYGLSLTLHVQYRRALNNPGSTVSEPAIEVELVPRPDPQEEVPPAEKPL